MTIATDSDVAAWLIDQQARIMSRSKELHYWHNFVQGAYGAVVNLLLKHRNPNRPPYP